jgi:hypothetical protein
MKKNGVQLHSFSKSDYRDEEAASQTLPLTEGE